MAETRKDAESAFDFFLEAYGPKYDKAAACLAKDRDVLLTFYDFPAEHWKHVRTTNPIESTFATSSSAHRTGPRAACRARRRWPWSSNYASALRENGENSMDRTMRRDHSRRQIRRWRTPGSRRRMISPYTTFDWGGKNSKLSQLLTYKLWKNIELKRSLVDFLPPRQLLTIAPAPKVGAMGRASDRRVNQRGCDHENHSSV